MGRRKSKIPETMRAETSEKQNGARSIFAEVCSFTNSPGPISKFKKISDTGLLKTFTIYSELRRVVVS